MIVGASLAGAKAAEELRERGLRRPRGADRRRARAPVRAPAAHRRTTCAASREREKALRARGGLLRRARDRAATRHDRDRDRPEPSRASTLADGERARLRPAAARHRRGAAPAPGPRRRPRRRPLPAHARRLRRAARARSRGGGRVAVVGAGWIGSEFAASARQRGLEVTLIEPDGAAATSASSAPRSARSTATSTRAHGVELRARRGRRGLRGRAARSSACARPRPRDRVRPRRRRHRRDPAQRARGGAGPARWTTASSSTTALQTRRPDVFAAGDVASATHPFYGRGSASSTGPTRSTRARAAARSMLGDARQLRPAAVLLLRPVRRRHGVLGLRPGRRRGRASAAIRLPASSWRSGSATDASRRA